MQRPPKSTQELTGASTLKLLWRGTIHRCPVCGGGGVIRRWFWMEDRCPTCSLRYERIDGQVIGSIGLNIMISFAATFVVLLVGSIVMIPNIRRAPLLFGSIITAGVFPVALLPSCRLGWCAIDLLLRPLEPSEVDPRFVNEE